MRRPTRRGWWSGYLAGAATVVALGLVWQTAFAPPPAWAQIPDSGRQRQDMLKVLVESNRHLTDIKALLKDMHDVQVPAKKTPTGGLPAGGE